MSKIVIFGTGDIARLAHFYFTSDSNHHVVAFTVDAAHLKNTQFCGLPVVDFKRVEKLYPPRTYHMFVALSYTQLNRLRARKYLAAKNKGYRLVNYISSLATVFKNVQIGDNCFILEDNTLQPFVKIGNDVTLWSGNHIGHDTQIENHCFVSSQVVVSGFCQVKPYCFLGVNSAIHNGIVIAPQTIVGAGAVITENTVEKGVYVPPRSIRLSKSSDKIKL